MGESWFSLNLYNNMSRFIERRWVVIPTTLTGSIDFSEVLENGPDTLRLSLNGSKTFVKYNVNSKPSFVDESYTELTHAEITELLTTEEWSTPVSSSEG
jgi:hypothetical protein